MVRDELTLLTNRLERLERASSRWRRGCVAALCLSFALVLSGQGGERRALTAESFRLVGPGGELRGLLSVTDGGNAALSLHDAQQRVRTSISVQGSGRQQVSFLDTAGEVVMTLGGSAAGSPTMVFKDAAGATRISLTSEPAAGLIVNNAAGEDRAILAVSSGGDGVFRIKDAQGNVTK